MNHPSNRMNHPPNRLYILFALLISGGCFYLALKLSNPQWWALWLAPVPVLVLSLRMRPAQAFGLAFAARLIGQLSWYGYLSSLLPLPVTLVFTTIFPLIFALIILLSRKLILRFAARPMLAALVYPILYTSFEMLWFLFSRDGTFASIAYTQYGCPPLIQLASLTGLTGISFWVSFVAATISLSIHFRQRREPFRKMLITACAVLLLVLGFGWLRLSDQPAGETESVGMIAYPYKTPLNKYLDGISTLAAQGAKIVLLPEKVIDVRDSTAAFVRQALSDTARRLGVTIVAGIARVYPDRLKCEAWVFTPDGRQPLAYQKVNLFEGETIEGFTPGKDPGFFDLGASHFGVAICKDLDFQRYMLRYGGQHMAVLLVPAWDFNRDGWLHSRMAMMRAIELGCPLVRNAREGRMTISDSRGRVLSEASTEGDGPNSLIAPVTLEASPTLYQQWGDWFGWLNLIALAALLLSLFSRPGRSLLPKHRQDLRQ